MEYDKMIDIVNSRFPEMIESRKQQIDDFIEEWGKENEPLNYIYFGDIFNKFILYEIIREDRNQKLINRIFDFIEEMIISSDVRVQTLAEVEPLEVLRNYGKEIYEEALKRYHPESLKANENLDANFRKPQKSSLTYLKELEPKQFE